MVRKRCRQKSASPREPKRTRHHLRPSSRGGMDAEDYGPNELSINDDSLHRPYHTLFSNLRPNEIILLLMFTWATVCPHIERKESNTLVNNRRFVSRKRVWEKFFGNYEDWDSVVQREKNMKLAIRKIIEEFVRTREDREQVERALLEGLRSNFITDEDFNDYSEIMRANGA